MTSVSVVLAVRDGSRYLGEAIESVLSQTVSPSEFVVVDDGSVDDSAAIADSFGGVSVLRGRPAGQAAAMNRGVAASESDALAFIDADDVWPATSLEARLGGLDDAGLDRAVFGRVEQFLSPEVDETEVRFRFEPGPRRVDVVGTMLIGRAAFTRVGLFDERLPSAAVVDWLARARAVGIERHRVDDVVLRRRLHERNWGRVAPGPARAGLLEAVRAHHRRAKGG